MVQTSWTHDDTPISAVCPLAFPPEGFAVIGTGSWIPAETGWRKQGPVGQSEVRIFKFYPASGAGWVDEATRNFSPTPRNHCDT